MNHIKLYSRGICGWCLDAKQYLHAHNIPFDEVDVGRNPAAFEEMVNLSGQKYVPTIVVNGHVLADFDVAQLQAFLAKLNVAGAPPTS